MFIRHLMFRFNHLFVLCVLLLVLLTTVLNTNSYSYDDSLTTSPAAVPAQVASGWSDPIGG